MGLTCRFLGHTFGDSEIEHTREERGNEVVATVKKTRTCKRCNIEQVISQNKEVTSIRPTETPETNLSDNTETDASSDGWESAPDHEHVRADDSVETTQDDSPVNDAVILNNESTEQDEAQWPTDIETPPHDAGKPTAGEQTGESVQKKHDDTGAEILDSDTDTNTDPHSETTEETSATSNVEIGQETTANNNHKTSPTRTRKEWPPSGRDTVNGESLASATSWPDTSDEDEGYTARPDTDSVSIEFGGEGLTPQVENRQMNDETAVSVDESLHARKNTREQTQNETKKQPFVRASEANKPESTVPDSHVELYCPHCEHSHPADISSMRAGDICPECQNGYIDERKR